VLKDAESENVVVNCDKSDAGLEVVSSCETVMAQHLPSAIASPNSAQEEERIPRVIVTTCFPGAIAISSGSQDQEVQEQSGSSLGAVEQDRSAIAPTNMTQEEQETLPRVIITPRIEGAIATNSTSQQRISEPQPPKDISPPVPSPVKPQPVVPKKLSDEEIQKLDDELKRLKISLEPCMNVVQKYWNNVNGAIARVKEAIQNNWCTNPTGLFIASCKKGVKPEKTQVSNEVNEWFTWARAKRIVIAMSGDVAYTADGEPVSLQEMMELHPMME